MADPATNNLVRFINVSRKKDGLFANFKMTGEINGAKYKASLAVPIAAAEVDPGDSLEKIIEECARMAVREFKKCNFQFEGLSSI
jgi:hypothetical protein